MPGKGIGLGIDQVKHIVGIVPHRRDDIGIGRIVITQFERLSRFAAFESTATDDAYMQKIGIFRSVFFTETHGTEAQHDKRIDNDTRHVGSYQVSAVFRIAELHTADASVQCRISGAFEFGRGPSVIFLRGGPFVDTAFILRIPGVVVTVVQPAEIFAQKRPETLIDGHERTQILVRRSEAQRSGTTFVKFTHRLVTEDDHIGFSLGIEALVFIREPVGLLVRSLEKHLVGNIGMDIKRVPALLDPAVDCRDRFSGQ